MQSVVQSSLEFVQSLAEELSSHDFELPSFPDSAERVRRALDDKDCSAVQVARVVGTDAALAAHVMRMANSVACNPRGIEITSLQIAVGRLGHETIRSAAVAMAMRQLANTSATPELKERLRRLWKHSVQVAAVAFTLAKRVPFLNQDEAMLAGLVHDIGELYLLKRAAEHPELLADPAALDELIEQWHTSVGRTIVDAWAFPESVVTAVDEHEELDRDMGFGATDLASAILVANLFVRCDTGEIAEVDWDSIPSFKSLSLTTEYLDSLRSDSAAEIRSIVEALNG